MNRIQNPISYILRVQKTAAGLVFLSLFGLVIWLFFFDPTEHFFIIASFLVLCFLLLASSLTLIAFWWYFSVQKQIVTINQAHKIIGQSTVSASILITLVVMQQTQQLNIVTFAILVISYILYQLWSATDES